MALKLEAGGGKGGNQWDDGADHDNVTKIYVRGGLEGIQHVKFDYIKSGQPKDGTIHGFWGKGFTETFEINHLNDEHLVSVKGCYDNHSGVIQSLQFETNMRKSEVMGYNDKGDEFILEVTGKKIVGFHGSVGIKMKLKSLGAHVITLPPIKLEQQGGIGGSPWDHSVHTGVRKVYVTYSPTGISHIMVDYDQAGKVEKFQNGDMKGENRVQGKQNEFVLDYPNEYITSVEGTCDDPGKVPGYSNRVRSLSFKTSKGRSSPTYGIVGKKAFVLESKGRALVGFHGRGGWAIDAIGAYFTTVPPIKLEQQGGPGGSPWDHGARTGIRKVCITYSPSGISHIMVDYDKAGKVETLQNGDMKGENRVQGKENEFLLDYPNEYIVSVKGTCDQNSGTSNRVRSLSFMTSKERISPTYGIVGKKTFVLECKGRVLVGFHGRAGWAIDAIGAYFGLMPIPCPPPVEKLQAMGGEGGATWDDGIFDGVRRIYVGKGEYGRVKCVKFVYGKGDHVVLGEDHGNKTMLGYEEFNLDYPSEYITVVEGSYGQVYGIESAVITMLKFKTNKQTSPSFGFKSSSILLIGKQDHKIVGFHGKASDELYQLGVSVTPIRW